MKTRPTTAGDHLVAAQRDLWGDLVVAKRWGRTGAQGWLGWRTVEVARPAKAAKIVQETLKRWR